MRSDPIRIGLIGLHPDKGWASTAHIAALAQLQEIRVTVVNHLRGETARAAASKFGIPYAVDTVRELVRHPEVDLVVVAVKVSAHRQIVEESAAAGKPVFCEWPLTAELSQSEDLVQKVREAGVRSFIGLQGRSTPAFLFVRDLIRDGYVGRVLSSTLLGSGLLWGGQMPSSMLYTLDPTSGATMMDVTFAHSVDSALFALNAKVTSLVAMTPIVRKSVLVVETGQSVGMTAPDQVAVAASLDSGALFDIHFRGGTSRATNFRWEINGTDGDLVVTTPMGYTGVGGFTIKGANLEGAIEDLPIPNTYSDGIPEGLTQGIALNYRRIAADLRSGTSLAPTFEDALELHRLINRIREAGKSGLAVTTAG